MSVLRAACLMVRFKFGPKPAADPPMAPGR
jgi:hypothetical protein